MLIEQINHFVQKNQLMPSGSKIILGLSGGPDSVFLFHYLADLQQKGIITLVAAHLDHEWRDDSSKDKQFCHEMARNLEIVCTSRKMSELGSADKFNGSLEELGRNARRYFLEDVKKEYNADYIALAHHVQDQQETFFIRLIRGTSLTGLTAMRPKHGSYIRPLLEINKKDIIVWLEEHNVPYLTDPSNAMPTFLRNRIRASVLPALQECDERFDVNFLVTLNRLKETENFLEHHTIEVFNTISSVIEHRRWLNLMQFLNMHEVMQYRVLMHWLMNEDVPFSSTQAFLDEVIRFLKQPEGKTHDIHEQWSLVKKKGLVTILKQK